ncbi:hypothetical protein QE152_g37014 [Popillia japonica]|uniref:Uncharacterized protein n=1 Tax=Popillia japonica TaxID=7064 RepID=A0AAW1IBS6_POPJA
MLEEISPLPSTSSTKFVTRQNRGGKSEILTSTPFKTQVEQKRKEKLEKQQIAEEKPFKTQVEQKRKEKLEKQQIAEENRIKRETKRKLKYEQDVTLKRTKVKSTTNKEQKKSVRPETQEKPLDTKTRKYLNFGEELLEECELTLGIICNETFEEDCVQCNICKGWSHENEQILKLTAFITNVILVFLETLKCR